MHVISYAKIHKGGAYNNVVTTLGYNPYRRWAMYWTTQIEYGRHVYKIFKTTYCIATKGGAIQEPKWAVSGDGCV